MRALLVCLLLAAIAPSASALVTRYDPDLIAKIAAPMDYKVSRKTEPAHHQKPQLDFAGPRNERWSAQGEVCDGKGNTDCKSIILSATLDTRGADPAAYAIHFNRNEAAVYMWAEDGRLKLTSYIILNGGVSETAVKEYVSAFSTVLRHTMDDLDPSRRR